jgi:hypothetical protein
MNNAARAALVATRRCPSPKGFQSRLPYDGPAPGSDGVKTSVADVKGSSACLHARGRSRPLKTVAAKPDATLRVARTDGEDHQRRGTPPRDLPSLLGRVAASVRSSREKDECATVGEMDGHDASQVLLAQYDYVVQTLAPD